MSVPEVREYLDAVFSGVPGQKCWLCGCMLTRRTATADHLVPQSLGGGHKPENLRPACAPCNGGRGNRELTSGEWLRALTYREAQPGISRKVMAIQQIVRRQREFEDNKRARSATGSAHGSSTSGVAGSSPAGHATIKEKPMKTQLWLTEPERDLVETALKSWLEEADRESVGMANKRCRGYVSRRIAALLVRVEKKQPPVQVK